MDSITITDNSGEKRLKAIIKYTDGKTKTVTFGMKGSKGAYPDGATDAKRDAYIARHRVREDWTDEQSAGFMSRWVLWEARTNAQIGKVLKDKTGAKQVTVKFTRIPVKK